MKKGFKSDLIFLLLKLNSNKKPFMNKLSFNYTSNAKTISSFAGLKIYDDLIHKFEIRKFFGTFLPKKKRVVGHSSWNKFYTLIMGFIAGFECLDDFDFHGQDPLFLKLTSSPASTTLGKFLKVFTQRDVEQVQEILPKHALKMRMNLTPNLKKITLKMDASDHLQHGLKMEGVTFGYKKFRCLSSQMIFDDKGLCYGFNLRSGNTHSVVDGPEMLYKTLSVIPNDVEKLFIADSAYSSMEMYNTCLNQRCNFIICLKENIWATILKNNHGHLKWKKTNLKFFESNNCQTASTLYYPKGLAGGTKCLRVVFIRTKNLSPKKGDKHTYHYYAVVTDISESRMKNEKILKNYRKRSQVENNIKDLKNGMDFHHFPTGKLKANNVWGVAGIIAYNLMRYTSFQIAGERGCFLKATRRRLVLMAGEIITHARSIEIRLMNYIYAEVCRIKAMINFVSTTDANRLRPRDGVKT
jgi:hypothetical protein